MTNFFRGGCAHEIFFFRRRMNAIQVVIHVRGKPGVQDDVSGVDAATLEIEQQPPAKCTTGWLNSGGKTKLKDALTSTLALSNLLALGNVFRLRPSIRRKL